MNVLDYRERKREMEREFDKINDLVSSRVDSHLIFVTKLRNDRCVSIAGNSLEKFLLENSQYVRSSRDSNAVNSCN